MTHAGVTPREGLRSPTSLRVQFYARILLPPGSGPIIGPVRPTHTSDLRISGGIVGRTLNPSTPTRNLLTRTPFRPAHTMDSLTHTAEIPRTSKKFHRSADHPPRGRGKR